MAASDAPTHALGGTNTNYGGSFGYGYPIDDLEHVPELTWPLSVAAYGRMRTDPTIASILAAYTGPLLAAEWRIDPRGAHPEAVRICADSFGIPVVGEKVEDIGAVRRRGVKFNEHIRLAALHLVFGHFGFEPVYEVRPDGFAYLSALPERMPSTIVDIQVNDDGTMKAIVQQGQPGKKTNSYQGVEIPADRLLWYCNDREGSVFQGRALIRPCYTDWLLKIDTKRVNAIGIARFGAGTPVMEANPGTNPTPAQITEAQRLASAVRVGQSGGAVPVGFTLRIKGVEGTLPDAIPTLNYYDGQMARAALTSILDLGNTATGSRALGDNFADMLQRALQSIGNRMAETASQLCERLTTFNFGESAIPPVVSCGDVGASKATIANSIVTLVQAGAITPDPALEAYMREAYKLPLAAPVAPTEEAEPTSKCGAPKENGDPCTRLAGWGTTHPGEGPCKDHDGSKKVAAAQVVRPTRVSAATYREPTEAERAAGVDPAQVDAEQDALVVEGMALFAAVVLAWGAALVAQILAALTAGSLVALARMKLRTGDATEALQLLMHEAASVGVRQVLGETARAGAAHGVTEADIALPLAELDDAAEALAEHAASTIAGQAGREAGRQGLDTTPEEVDAIVGQSIPGPVQRLVERAVAEAMGTGRTAAIDAIIRSSPGIDWEVFASGVRDAGQCEPCKENDGRVYADLSEGRRDFPLGLYRHCEGRDRCRCLLAMRPIP